MRTIAHKGEGRLILAIFVRTYYVDDPCNEKQFNNYKTRRRIKLRLNTLNKT